MCNHVTEPSPARLARCRGSRKWDEHGENHDDGNNEGWWRMCLAVLAAGPRRHRRHHSAPRRSSQRDWPGRRSSGISPPAERDSPLAAAPKIRARPTTPAYRLATLRPPGGRGERGRRVTASTPARKNLGLRSAQALFPSPHPHHHHAIPRASCEPRAISAVVRRRPIRLPVSIGLPPGPPATAASFPLRRAAAGARPREAL